MGAEARVGRKCAALEEELRGSLERRRDRVLHASARGLDAHRHLLLDDRVQGDGQPAGRAKTRQVTRCAPQAWATRERCAGGPVGACAHGRDVDADVGACALVREVQAWWAEGARECSRADARAHVVCNINIAVSRRHVLGVGLGCVGAGEIGGRPAASGMCFRYHRLRQPFEDSDSTSCPSLGRSAMLDRCQLGWRGVRCSSADPPMSGVVHLVPVNAEGRCHLPRAGSQASMAACWLRGVSNTTSSRHLSHHRTSHDGAHSHWRVKECGVGASCFQATCDTARWHEE